MKSSFIVFIRWNLFPIFWSLFILVLCGLPGSDFPDAIKWKLLSFDKFVHAFLFLVLVLLSIKGLKIQPAFKTLRYNSIKLALGYAFFLSIITEVLQDQLFIERNADVYDVIANLSGSILGLITFYVIYGKENTFRFSSNE
ncbi:MAG: VanZ family protein [Bacteroidetes bacterium]|nr:VanZ family protein [Bacteroidota bacterium]HET6243212.1 VanZ family protein [Bacteroidia bacterium]